jgi:ELWxxDGT repeat protein
LRNLTVAGGLAYFEAPGGVRQVWRTDGSPAGTVPLTSFASASAATRNLTDVGGAIYFVVIGNGEGGAELWRSGGTAASTAPVVDPARFASVNNLADVNGLLFFAAAPASDPTDVELWKSDGTDAGTVRVADLAAGTAGSAPQALTNVNGTLYFLADDGVNGPGLWKSDGTQAGTVLIETDASLGHSAVMQSATAVGNTLYYVAPSGGVSKLYKSDGTAAGSGLVSDFSASFNANPGNLTAYGDTLLFTATTADGGRELWRSDGTPGGTTRVVDLVAGPASSSPANLVAFAGDVYFTASDGRHGIELWKTDGTASGTTLAVDVVPGAAGSNPGHLTPLAGSPAPRLLFSADDGSHGNEPWVTDGTAAGTRMIKNLVETPVGSPTSIFVTVGHRIFFNGPGGLWVTDGAGAHTRFLSTATIDATGFVSISGVNIEDRYKGLPTTADVGGVLFYHSNGKLWRSDGTPTGTYLVSGAPFNLSCLAASGGLLYFSAEDGVNGHELWRSDGTAAGTYRIVGLGDGSGSTLPRNISAVNGTVFYTASKRLYRSDGTAAGTVALTGSVFDDNVYQFSRIGNLLYFTTLSDVWRSDGTAAGTFAPTSGKGLYVAQSSRPRQVGAFVYFLAATNGVPGLWRTDGTTGATTLVKSLGGTRDSKFQPGYDLTVVGDRMFFTGPGHSTLWTSDGTAAGTSAIATFDAASLPAGLTSAGGLLYFASNGRLWSSDGTAGGTAQVSNDPGPALSLVQNLTAVDEALVFSAFHPLYDNELWIVNALVAVPAAPTDLIATPVSGARVHLTWLDASTTESGFRLERSDDPNFTVVDESVMLAPGRTAYDDRPLDAGATYYYRLVAFNRGGDSGAVTATATTPAVVPDSPTGVTASLSDDHLVRLTWQDNATDEAGYVVERSTTPDFQTLEATFALPSNTTSISDTGTTALNRYYYRVYAVGAGGNSDYTSTFVITPDRAPSQVQAVGVSPSQVDLQWANEGTTVTSFRIERAPGAVGSPGGVGAFSQIAVVQGVYASYSDVNLPALSTWTYRVVSVSPSGGSTSATVVATTTPPVLTTPVASLPPVTDHSPTSQPSRVLVSNGVGYFIVGNASLWRTDGTAAGTYLVRTYRLMHDLVNVDGTLFFVAAEYGVNSAVYKSDGTAAGTVIVKDINPLGNAFLHDLVPFHGALYFRGVASNSDSDSLWTSDGTAAGTQEVKRFGWRNGGDVYRHMIVSGDRLWLGANVPDGSNVPGVYVSDGTAAGTTLITTPEGVAPIAEVLLPAGDAIYFLARATTTAPEVWWRSDGTPAGTFTIANAPLQQWGNARALGDTMYLPGFADATGWELYKIVPGDGTATLVQDVTPGAASSNPHGLTPFGPGLAFFATGAASVSLYLTGGSDASTTFVKSFPAMDASTVPEAYALGDRLYFFVHESGQWALYVSDGTADGTTLLRRFYGAPQPGGFSPLPDGRLTFSADDGINGLEPWLTDGTAAGTQLVKDLSNRSLPTKPDSMVRFKGAIYFTFTPMGGGGGPVYRTDGTAGGTSIVYDGRASGLFVAGDHIYFSAFTPETGTELWITDGTPEGTRLVADVRPGTASSDPMPFGWLGDSLVFGVLGADGQRYDLWRTDGSAAGTSKVFDQVLRLETGDNLKHDPVVRDGVMYFMGEAPGFIGNEVWRTDGTAAGTYRVVDLSVGGSNPEQFTVLGGAVYFSAYSDTYQKSLWRTDGTAGGTSLIMQGTTTGMTAVKGSLYFSGPGGLYRSDGTPEGTQLLSAVSSPANQFTAVGDRIYFTSRGGLWMTDGTPAGTIPIRGMGISSQGFLADVAGTLFYSDGRALWKSDGTFAGTTQVMTIADNSNQQIYMSFTGALGASLGDLLLFGAMTPDGGRELRTAYATAPAAPDTLAVSAPPAASPGQGAVSASAPTGIRLTWVDHASNESGFVIDRSTTADFATSTQFFVPADTTSYVDATASLGDAFFYRVRTYNAAGLSAASNSIAAGAPTLLGAAFGYDKAVPDVTLRFAADVSASLSVGDVHLYDFTTNSDVAVESVRLAYDRADNTATITFAGGQLADGRYRLTLHAGEVSSSTGLSLDGNGDGTAGDDFTFDFFSLRGDANRDGAVNFLDLVALAQNYNTSGGKTYAQGDFNGDGAVDFLDLVVLAQRYHTALAAPGDVAAGSGIVSTSSDPMPLLASVIAQVSKSQSTSVAAGNAGTDRFPKTPTPKPAPKPASKAVAKPAPKTARAPVKPKATPSLMRVDEPGTRARAKVSAAASDAPAGVPYVHQAIFSSTAISRRRLASDLLS